MNKEEYKEYYSSVYRHSLAHVLADAVMEIFGKENVQIAIGPQIADGFYYDFLLPRNLNQDDYPVIEDKMKEILKRKEDWRVEEYSREDALKLFEGQKYKTELIRDLPEDEVITVYHTGEDFVDLCRGPH
ncbi:MAG: threonine--tRNA ligase, partial [Anaerolineaceae bacterium]|nr:threonine--tRNA ligase [Anaerolineaceae bacterium]